MNKEKNYIFSSLGASNHSENEREENDYYATEPRAVELFLDSYNDFSNNIWECCYGEGHIGDVLEKRGYKVFKTDIIERSRKLDKKIDMLNLETFGNKKFKGDIITNPPYKYSLEILKNCLELINDGNKVVMLLRLQFLETKTRYKFFKEYPPKYVFVHSGRIVCAKNGDFNKSLMSAMAYCWYVWEKGYKGDTTIKWLI